MKNKESHPSLLHCSSTCLPPSPPCSCSLREVQNSMFEPCTLKTQKQDTVERWENNHLAHYRCEGLHLCMYLLSVLYKQVSSHSFKKLSILFVKLLSVKKKTDPFIPLWVHPTRPEKQMSIHLSQQPLHTTHITVLKPSTWQLINNWLTCFSGELDDSTLAALSAWSPAETETKETNSIMKPQTAITLLYFTIRDANTSDSLWSQHCFLYKQPLLHISAVTTHEASDATREQNEK